jgi:hypothetical protein
MPAELKPDPAPRSFTSVLGFVMALNTVIGMYAAGLTGVAVVILAGPGFAQFLWMARADTPVEPHLPYPWLATFVCALLPVPLIRKRQWVLAGLAAIPFAVLPFVQLHRLYIAATPTLFE